MEQRRHRTQHHAREREREREREHERSLGHARERTGTTAATTTTTTTATSTLTGNTLVGRNSGERRRGPARQLQVANPDVGLFDGKREDEDEEGEENMELDEEW